METTEQIIQRLPEMPLHSIGILFLKYSPPATQKKATPEILNIVAGHKVLRHNEFYAIRKVIEQSTDWNDELGTAVRNELIKRHPHYDGYPTRRLTKGKLYKNSFAD